jgi:hypothetical protein
MSLQPRQTPAVLMVARVLEFDTLVASLGTGILPLSTRVASIVQGIADEFNVTSSRTNGESYLFVWRLSKFPQRVRDCAVAAAVKMLIAIYRDPVLREYRCYPPIAVRIPDYRVRLSFALHEGLVFGEQAGIRGGLNFELFHILPAFHIADAVAKLATSYSSLGVLATDYFLNSCSILLRCLFRAIDAIEPTSSTTRCIVSCLETDPHCEIDPVDLTRIIPLSHLEIHRKKLQRKADKWSCDIYDLIVSDPHFGQLIGPFGMSTVWAKKFQRGFLEFQAGEWNLAKTALEETKSISTLTHGPSVFLLGYMSKNNFVAPANWHGFRQVL